MCRRRDGVRIEEVDLGGSLRERLGESEKVGRLGTGDHDHGQAVGRDSHGKARVLHAGALEEVESVDLLEDIGQRDIVIAVTDVHIGVRVACRRLSQKGAVVENGRAYDVVLAAAVENLDFAAGDIVLISGTELVAELAARDRHDHVSRTGGPLAASAH